MPTPPPRVVATESALALVARLRERYGALIFHQSGGCCDGSSPLCYAEGDLITGDSDRCIGEIGGCRFFIGAAQFEYWRHTQLVIDVVPGRGGMFSLENGEGVRFLTRSRVFGDEEYRALKEAEGEGGAGLLR